MHTQGETVALGGVKIYAANCEALRQPSVLLLAVSVMVLLVQAIGPDVHPPRATRGKVGATPAVRGVRVAIGGRVFEFYRVAGDVEVLPGAVKRKDVRGQHYL